MKKIIISAATVAAFVAAGTIAYYTSEQNQEKDLIQANYEALLDNEGATVNIPCIYFVDMTCNFIGKDALGHDIALSLDNMAYVDGK